jgi:hypothetical protein
MIFKLKETPTTMARPRITPDPNQLEALQRRLSALNYQPMNGFHRDQRQHKQSRRLRG